MLSYVRGSQRETTRKGTSLGLKELEIGYGQERPLENLEVKGKRRWKVGRWLPW